MPTTDKRIDAYIRKAAPFAQPILTHLRKAIHAGCPAAEETLKWSHPTFMYKGILCGMAAFKQHATFGFWKHTLLVNKGLPKAEEDAMGQFGRITSVSDLPNATTLVKLVKAAAALNDAGIKVEREKRPAKPPVKAPPDLMAALRGNRKALATFQGFSPSKQRDYVEWVTEAKTEATRERRLETAVEWMAAGKSRNWKYENC
jgi:uncharacterized protein YdeI (YjbR/CyaY-like superfamily)